MRLILLLNLIVLNLYAMDIQKPKVYQGDEDISGWYMSEKLDGIRGVWDGRKLYSKNGKSFYPPKSFMEAMPPFAIDGELWTKRDDFENIQSIVLDKSPSKQWRQIKYMVFEVPDMIGDFQTRLNKLKKWLEKNPTKIINIIPQIKCKDQDHLNEFLNKIIKKKGEGVIVKDPNLDYHTGRSSYILKVKKAHDMEGLVVGVNYKKDDKTMKSLQIMLDNGVVFNLGGGFSASQRQNHPKIGQTITFKYYGFTKNGKPKFASYLRIRKK